MENQEMVTIPAEELDRIISFIKKQRGKSKSRQETINEIVAQIKPLVEGAKGRNLSVKVEGDNGETRSLPQININIPDIVIPKQEPIEVRLPEMPEIKVPKAEVEVRIPKIEVPRPVVNVNVPDVIVPEIKMPKEMEVKGFSGAIKNILDAIKGVFRVSIEGITRENPLPVRIIGNVSTVGGGGGQIVGGIGGSGIMAEIKDQLSPRGEVGTGVQTVAAAGTAEKLSPVSIPCKRVFIQALESNTNAITVGDSHVVGALVGRRGFALYPTQGDWFNVSNLNLLYLDVITNGEGVSFMWEN